MTPWDWRDIGAAWYIGATTPTRPERPRYAKPDSAFTYLLIGLTGAPVIFGELLAPQHYHWAAEASRVSWIAAGAALLAAMLAVNVYGSVPRNRVKDAEMVAQCRAKLLTEPEAERRAVYQRLIADCSRHSPPALMPAIGVLFAVAVEAGVAFFVASLPL